MARYIDIDQLIDKIEGTDWYHISKLGELARGANSKYDIPLYKHSDIKEVLNNAPTEDVVPRSEVDKWKAICEQLHKEMSERIVEERKIERKLAKQEVAKQIFEEIERTLDNYHSACLPVGAIEAYTYYEGGLGEAIAELKKKYIGE